MNPPISKPVSLSSLIYINGAHILHQKKPRITSGNHPIYKHKRSFTHSPVSYERAGQKEYIILMRNFEYTKEYPNFHVIATFQKQMSIVDFSNIRNIAFTYLGKWKVRGYFVHEPTPSRNGLHIHIATIYGRTQDDLRDCVKYAWEYSGLKYDQDFHVIVKPIAEPDKDYKRLCSYILKFNGKRKTNLRTPRLFIKGLRLRKTGSFGKWFVKTKKELWAEYREECRIRREARQALSVQSPPQDVFDALGDAFTLPDLSAVSSTLDREGFYIDSQDNNEDWQPWIDTQDIR